MITAHSETSKLLLLTILSSSNSIVCFNANGTSRSLKILKFYIDFKFLLFRFRFSFSKIIVERLFIQTTFKSSLDKQSLHNKFGLFPSVFHTVI